MDWNYLLYLSAFLPLLLVVLTAHELGHFLAARYLKLHVSGFHIGAGPALFTRYRGQTAIRLPAPPRELPVLTQTGAPPQAGDRVVLAVAADPVNPNELQGLAWLPTRRKDHPRNSRQAAALLSHCQNSPALQGRLLSLENTQAIIAPVAWSLRPIPLAAGVLLPEDPGRAVPGFYNTAAWPKRTAVILAGPVANFLLALTAIALAALLPVNPTPANAVLEVTTVSGPAQEAGFQPGDRLLRAGRVFQPTLEELIQERDWAARRQQPLTVTVARQGQNLELQTTGLAAGTAMGLAVQPIAIAGPAAAARPYNLKAAARRFLTLNRVYYAGFSQLLHPGPETLNQVSSPIMTAHQTARLMQRSGWIIWLYVLALVSLSIGLLNLLPLPPLDGYRLAAETLASLRGGKTLSPQAEGIIAFYGIVLLACAALGLALRDLLLLLS